MNEMFAGIENLALLHPMVVHLPITYVLTALLFEAIRFFTRNERVKLFAEWMVYLGAVAAIAAVGAGHLAAEHLGHDAPGHDLVHVHRNIMISMTVGLALTAIALALFPRFRNGSMRQGLLVALVALTGVMAYGADKGGQLVYRYGTGVDPRAFHVPAQAGRVTNTVPAGRMEADDHHDNANAGMEGRLQPHEPPVDHHDADGHTH